MHESHVFQPSVAYKLPVLSYPQQLVDSDVFKLTKSNVASLRLEHNTQTFCS